MCQSFIKAFVLLDATAHPRLALSVGGTKSQALKQEFSQLLLPTTAYSPQLWWVSESSIEPTETMKTCPSASSEARGRGKEGTCCKAPTGGQVWDQSLKH